MESHKLRA